jgi:hypothetical protein
MSCAPRPEAERFWDLVNGPWCDRTIGGSDCWLWMGSTAGSRPPKDWKKTRKPWKRYGRFRSATGKVNAHRMALMLTAGEPPDPAMVASHTVCDRPLCCNPTHLEWASQAANMAEAMRKRHLDRSSISGRFASLAAAVVA